MALQTLVLPMLRPLEAVTKESRMAVFQAEGSGTKRLAVMAESLLVNEP